MPVSVWALVNAPLCITSAKHALWNQLHGRLALEIFGALMSIVATLVLSWLVSGQDGQETQMHANKYGTGWRFSSTCPARVNRTSHFVKKSVKPVCATCAAMPMF